MFRTKFCNDILHIIASYLQFDDKVIFGNLCNKNFLRFYDFNNNPKFRLCDEIADILAPLEYYDDMVPPYRMCPDDILEGYITTRIKNGDNLQDDENSQDIENLEYWGFSNVYCDDLPYEGINTDMHHYKHKKLYRYCRDNYKFDDIFLTTLFLVHVKKIIDYIENNRIKIKYNKGISISELEHQLPMDHIEKLVYKYYEHALFYYNMNYFCRRCANFGHTSENEQCIFYNKDYVDQKIRKDHEQKEKERLEKERREETMKRLKCVHCKHNQKKNKCPENACINCCSTRHQGHMK